MVLILDFLFYRRIYGIKHVPPVEFKLKNGVNRYIFREAFKDILPTSI